MLPELNYIRRQTNEITVFRGLNKTCNTGFSRVSASSSNLYTEFKDMRNLSSDNFPVLSPRKPRSRLSTLNDAKIISNVLCVNGGFIYVDDMGYLYHRGRPTELSNFDVSIPRQLVQFGNNVLIFPDKKYVNLTDGTLVSMEVKNTAQCVGTTDVEAEAIDAVFYCSIDKVALNTSVKPRSKKATLSSYVDFSDESQQSDNTSAANYSRFIDTLELGDTVEECNSVPSKLWMCTSEEANANYYNGRLKHFTVIENYYVRITAEGIGANLKIGDFVKISGLVHNVGETGWDKGESYVDTLNGKFFKLYDVSQDYIVIKTNIDSSVPYCGNVTVERLVPEMDAGLIVEVDNRLWGCSSKNNEIYACKLGDCNNWYAYSDGISTDSYAMTVGVEGQFTGISKMNSSVVFFKENYALKIYGTKPSNFALSTYKIAGVEKNSSQSIVNMGDYLLYKSKDGIVQYSGGTSVLVSEEAFGNEIYTDAIAGKHRHKYYVSLKNRSGRSEVFVFDTQKGLWHKEDDTAIRSTATYNDTMYYVDELNNFIMCPDDDSNLLETIDKDNSSFNTGFCGEIFIDSSGNSRLIGDLDNDGVISNSDVALLQKRLAEHYEFSDDELKAADIDGNGFAEVYDVTLLQAYVQKQKYEKEDFFSWFAETGDLYDSDFNTKFISKIRIGIKPDKSTRVRVLAKFRDGNDWTELYKIMYDEKRPRIIPVQLRKAEYLKLRIEGEGYCEIYGISITYQKGSEIR